MKVMDKMFNIARTLDTNFDNKISYKEFGKIVDNKEALTALQEVGVNPIGIVDFAELFFFDEGSQIELEFHSFMNMILDLREDNIAKVKDVLNIWRQIKFSTNADVTNMTEDVDRV